MHDTAEFTMIQENLRDIFTHPSLGATRRNVSPGEVLCEPNAAAENLFFIESGQVRVYQVAPDGPANSMKSSALMIGFASALAEHAHYGSRVVAVGPVTIWEVPAPIAAAIPYRPTCCRRRVDQTTRRQACCPMAESSELIFDDCDSRLIKTLLRSDLIRRNPYWRRKRRVADHPRAIGPGYRCRPRNYQPRSNAASQAKPAAYRAQSVILQPSRIAGFRGKGRKPLIFRTDSIYLVIIWSPACTCGVSFFHATAGCILPRLSPDTAPDRSVPRVDPLAGLLVASEAIPTDMVMPREFFSAAAAAVAKSSRMRWASTSASAPLARGNSSTNSSPPYRAATSIRRILALMTFPASTSN